LCWEACYACVQPIGNADYVKMACILKAVGSSHGARGNCGHLSQNPDALLDSNVIAVNYLHVLRQPSGTWTWEMELRSWVEKL